MTVFIHTSITQRDTFRIAVSINGKFSHDLTATASQVVAMRNSECERWAAQATAVEANAIPQQTGHGFAGNNQWPGMGTILKGNK